MRKKSSRSRTRPRRKPTPSPSSADGVTALKVRVMRARAERVRLDYTRRAQGLYDKAELRAAMAWLVAHMGRVAVWLPGKLAPLIGDEPPEQAERIADDFVRGVLTKLSQGFDPITGEKRFEVQHDDTEADRRQQPDDLRMPAARHGEVDD